MQREYIKKNKMKLNENFPLNTSDNLKSLKKIEKKW